jgi:methyl-accepting chemotaxis protein
MIKLAVCQKENGEIYHVHSFDYYFDKGFSEEKILSEIEKSNKEKGYEIYKIIEVPSELEEVVSMLLGERKYKRCKDIDDILDSLEEIDSTISSVSRDIFDAAEAMERSKKAMEELQEMITKENKTKK